MRVYEKAEEHVVMTEERQAPTGLDNAHNQGDFLTEDLTGILKTVLNNPVLPSEFDLVDPTSALKHKWEFANGNRVPFAKTRRQFQSCNTSWER